jgi:hypothetical protein
MRSRLHGPRPAPPKPPREETVLKAQAFDLLQAGEFLPRKKAAQALRIARSFGR